MFALMLPVTQGRKVFQAPWLHEVPNGSWLHEAECSTWKAAVDCHAAWCLCVIALDPIAGWSPSFSTTNPGFVSHEYLNSQGRAIPSEGSVVCKACSTRNVAKIDWNMLGEKFSKDITRC